MEDVAGLLARGQAARRVGETKMNRESSRSHSVSPARWSARPRTRPALRRSCAPGSTWWIWQVALASSHFHRLSCLRLAKDPPNACDLAVLTRCSSFGLANSSVYRHELEYFSYGTCQELWRCRHAGSERQKSVWGGGGAAARGLQHQ